MVASTSLGGLLLVASLLLMQKNRECIRMLLPFEIFEVLVNVHLANLTTVQFSFIGSYAYKNV